MKKLPVEILKGHTTATTIEHLLQKPLDMTHPGERQLLYWVLPPWQRPEVWDEARKGAYIEGVFLGLGTGVYVAHEPNWDDNGTMPMSGWLIDGQQRISAVRDFVNDELVIFKDIRFSDLSLADQRKRFLRHPFPYIQIPYTTDEQVLKELYRRLNFSALVAHSDVDLQRLDEETTPISLLPRDRG